MVFLSVGIEAGLQGRIPGSGLQSVSLLLSDEVLLLSPANAALLAVRFMGKVAG